MIIKKIFKLIFKTCYCFCISVVSVYLLLFSTSFLLKYYNYVEFPNKARLMHAGFLKDEYVLKDKDNNLLVSANVDNIAYNDEYVYGDRMLKDNKETSFLYHGSWSKAEEYENIYEYGNRFRELNIDTSKEYYTNYDYLFKHTNLAVPLFRRIFK